METYLLKSVACLGILFFFYKLALENSSLHTVKRFYLLGSLVLSILIPFITFTEYIEVTPMATETFVHTPITVLESTETVAAPINYLPYILGGLYSLGVLIFSFRFGRNMLRIFNKARSNPKLKNQSIFHVLLKLPIVPHSFFNYIFFSKKDYEAGEIPQEVIVHETAHVEQKHSWDIVFFELLRIVFWFNPLLYFIKHSIKLNHEFLADRTVLNQGAELSTYQTILLDFSSPDSYRDPSLINLTHSINYSSIKKRFTVMKTHTSKRAAWLKGLSVILLLAVLIYGFSNKTIVTEDVSLEKVKESVSLELLEITLDSKGIIFKNEEEITLEEVKNINTQDYYYAKVTAHPELDPQLPKRVVDLLIANGFKNNLTFCLAKEEGITEIDTLLQSYEKIFALKASPKQLEIYNQLAKKYNAVPVSERKIGWEDLKTLENIYRQMSDSQKENALPFPECNLENKTSWEEEYAKAYNDGAARNLKKSIVITINVSEIMVNGKAVFLRNFAKEIDKETKDWTKEDFQAAHPSVLVAATPNSFMEKLDAEFRKTNYFKANGGESIIPTSPPPAPNAKEKTLMIYISESKILINNEEVLLKNFASTLNNITMHWTPSEIKNAKILYTSRKVNDLFREKLEFEYKQSMLYQYKKKSLLPPPPPPAPDAMKVIKGVNENDSNIHPPPPPPKVTKGVNDGDPNIPPPPQNPETIFKSISLKMTLVDPPNFGPQTDSKDPEVLLDLMLKHHAPLFFSSSIIDKKSALILLKAHSSVEIVTQDTPHDLPSVVFSTHKKY